MTAERLQQIRDAAAGMRSFGECFIDCQASRVGEVIEELLDEIDRLKKELAR